MRLINVKTLDFESFTDENIPEYAILSHTWEKDEMTFQDMQTFLRPKRKLGWEKIKRTCAQAQSDGFQFAWVDTCCIDKTSSAELQEAINSMYTWYKKAAICYVFLADVFWQPKRAGIDLSDEEHSQFKNCKWFTRGWTLQELIAPQHIEFFGHGWSHIGTKGRLIHAIAEATGIHYDVLKHRVSPLELSVATRMSWAAARQTSRIEDRAYSLMGLFDINMPMLYGEGDKAFTRLQEEIVRSSVDHSIFAWRSHDPEAGAGPLLARSPDNFSGMNDVVLWGRAPAFGMSNRGLLIELPVWPWFKDDEIEEVYAVLGCRPQSYLSHTFALLLHKNPESDEYSIGRGRAQTYDPNARVTLVERRQMSDAVVKQVLIPRQRKITNVNPFCVVTIDNSGRHKATSPKIIQTWPATSWIQEDASAITLRCSAGRRVRAGVALRSQSGAVLLIAFGYDQVSRDGKEKVLPGIWSEEQTEWRTLLSWADTQGRCDHAACGDACPAMKAQSDWRDPAEPSLTFRSSIWTEHLMDEDVINVMIKLTTQS